MSPAGTMWLKSTIRTVGIRASKAAWSCATYVSAVPKSVVRVTMPEGVAMFAGVRGIARGALP